MFQLSISLIRVVLVWVAISDCRITG